MTNSYFRTSPAQAQQMEVLQQALESEQARIKAEAAGAGRAQGGVCGPLRAARHWQHGCVRWQSAGAKLNEFTDFLLKAA
jgi:hypothetical protein